MSDKTSRKKIDKAVTTVVQSENYTFRPLKPEGDSIFAEGSNPDLGGFFKIVQEEEVKGLLYVGSAKGRYDWFDFIVIFNTKRIIEKVEIIVYRSDHGFEFMNKSWLAQFAGTTGCEAEYGKTVDAISGATLSASSLTKAINDICLNLETLKP
jgi:uncharacterized protein with FMN-binding domain